MRPFVTRLRVPRLSKKIAGEDLELWTMDPRPSYYQFAHVVLRQALRSDPLAFLSNFKHDPDSFLGAFWKKLGGPAHEAPRGRWVSRGGRDFALIEMAPPRGMTEAFFIAVLVAQPCRYFVLELGENEGGQPRTVLCEWDPRGNYGSGPEPDPEAFLDACLGLVQSPPELDRISLDPRDLHVSQRDLLVFLRESPPEGPMSVLKLFACMGCLLSAASKVHSPQLYRAAGLSWWSWRARRRARQAYAGLVLALLVRRVCEQNSELMSHAMLSAGCVQSIHFGEGALALRTGLEQDQAGTDSLGRWLLASLGRPQGHEQVQEVSRMLAEHDLLAQRACAAVEVCASVSIPG